MLHDCGLDLKMQKSVSIFDKLSSELQSPDIPLRTQCHMGVIHPCDWLHLLKYVDSPNTSQRDLNLVNA